VCAALAPEQGNACRQRPDGKQRHGEGAGRGEEDEPERGTRPAQAGCPYLLALALTAGVDVIVSGDRHLTQLRDPAQLLLTPRQFTEQLN